MHFCFESNELKKNDYKWIFQHLCEISNVIYFTYESSLMVNEKIFELCEQCERINVSEKIKNLAGYSILGFKSNIFIKLFIFEHENVFQLLEELGYGSILFYVDQNEIAYVGMDDFEYIQIQTNDKKLIKKLSAIG